MKSSRSIFRKACAGLLGCLLLETKPSLATDNHAYKTDEYATISEGLSPDGRWSIAAHGEGSDGYKDFQLYLMRDPAHEVLVPLSTGDHLDTGPLSIAALWAPDSRHVAILYRSDRHILDLRLFGIEDGKVQSIPVPSLVGTVGRKFLEQDGRDALASRYYRVAWKSPTRLALEEFDGFDAPRPIFRPGMEAYLEVDRRGSERTFTDFSASAEAEITPESKLNLTGIKPRSGQLPAIVYSPHLRFDSGRGLHDTETSMSSLGIFLPAGK